MSESHLALSSLAPIVYTGTALVAFILVCQVFGLDLAQHMNTVAQKIAVRGKVSRTGA